MGLVKGEIRGEGEAECVVWCGVGGRRAGAVCTLFFALFANEGTYRLMLGVYEGELWNMRVVGCVWSQYMGLLGCLFLLVW
jgi:hypothetical protein